MSENKKMRINPVRSLDPIYRKGEKGRVLYWRVEYCANRVRACSGIVGGKEKVGAWTTVGATNEGKANARSPAEQAIALANQLRDNKIRHGYHVSIDDIEQVKYFTPMLANKYDAKKPPEFPVRLQPKLNGERGSQTKTELRTRNGHLVVACPHILEALHKFFHHYPYARLDGELYNHDLREQLNRLMSLTAKDDPTDEELAESRKVVQFHVYDGFLTPDAAKDSDRFEKLALTLNAVSNDSCIKVVVTKVAKSAKEIESFYRWCLADGYEGAMIRLDGPYENKRSKLLLKYKPRYDAEFEIVGAEDGKGKREGMLSRVFCKLPNGKTFKANVKWSDPVKIDLWSRRDELVGKKATVSYAYLTEYGVPFHNYLERINGIK